MKKSLWIVLGIVVVVIIAVLMFTPSSPTGDHSALASCIADSGAIMYGAFWCPHCNNQKEMFGSGADELPYVECSTSDRTAQTQICIQEGIESYPTWEFSDGRRIQGVLSLQQLSDITGCPLN